MEDAETIPILPRDKRVISYVETDYACIDQVDPAIDPAAASNASDAAEILALAVPMFFSRVSWVGIKTTDSALLGHVGPGALAAASLSDLYTACSGVLIMGGGLGILVSQCAGSGNRVLAGIYLQVALIVLWTLSFAVGVVWWFTGAFWSRFLGDEGDPSVIGEAQYYSFVLSLCLPARVAFSQLALFFASQKIVSPEANTSIVAVILNLGLGLVLVLGVPIRSFDGYGFNAAPAVTFFVIYFQIFFMWFVFCHIRRMHIPSWDGWAPSEITFSRIKTFCGIYFPMAFSSASDFWRMGIIGALAARMGSLEVAVFNASYRVIWMALIFIGAISRAAAVLTGTRLGSGDSVGARRASLTGIRASFSVQVVVTLFAVKYARALGWVFSDDVEFLDMFETIRWPFVSMLFFMNMSVALENVPLSMGRTDEVLYCSLAGSWLGQVPCVFFLTTYWRRDLVGLFSGMSAGYALLLVLYSGIIITSDWNKYAEDARRRAEVTTLPHKNTTK
mmetsp:Transcript_35084/g.69126  ORF Transcript_35084/g.69126 Transcript_35084/m.69126 type:complete len:505 (-) Transcript_35084:503-2017(-)